MGFCDVIRGKEKERREGDLKVLGWLMKNVAGRNGKKKRWSDWGSG